MALPFRQKAMVKRENELLPRFIMNKSLCLYIESNNNICLIYSLHSISLSLIRIRQYMSPFSHNFHALYGFINPTDFTQGAMLRYNSTHLPPVTFPYLPPTRYYKLYSQDLHQETFKAVSENFSNFIWESLIMPRLLEQFKRRRKNPAYGRH